MTTTKYNLYIIFILGGHSQNDDKHLNPKQMI